VFPGQSTVATALGGLRAATVIAAQHRLPAARALPDGAASRAAG
jgi:hypothetical protein